MVGEAIRFDEKLKYEVCVLKMIVKQMFLKLILSIYLHLFLYVTHIIRSAKVLVSG